MDDRPAGTPLRILVLGATGYVGARLVPELLANGHRVRGASRSAGKLDARDWAANGAFESVVVDVLDPGTIAEAMTDVDVVYYLVHSMGRGHGDFAQSDAAAARNVAHAAAEAGVRRIIYLSGLGREDDQLSEHLASRHETGRELARGSVPVTELRAAIIVGSGSASFEIMRDLVGKLPLMITPRWLRTRCEPIAIRDVIAYLVGVLDEPRTIGEVLEIGGGEVHEYRELLATCGEVYGRRPRILTTPVLTPRLSSWWLHLVTHVDVSIARPLVEGLRNDVTCTDTRIREWMPNVELTPYRTAVERARAMEQAGTVLSRWTDARTIADREQAALSTLHAEQDVPEQQVFVDARTYECDLAPDELYASIERIGGDHGYGRSTQLLWRLRGALDRLVGGVGLRRGRREGPLRVGDVVDFWRVEAVEPGTRLVLRAEMRLPGVARLEFTVAAAGEGRARMLQRATLTNDGIWSRLYWYAIVPLHNVVFDRLARHLAGRTAVRVRHSSAG